MWHDIEQNTDAWLDMRAGKVTGSSIGKIMANYGKAFGDPAKKLAITIAVERITGKRVESDGFSNAHMERGHEEEPVARMLYEDMYFTSVSNGGFFDNGKTGSSPDGLVDDDGMVEIKSVIPTVHYPTVKRGSYDPKYKWQFCFNLRESGREWIDFVSYCSAYPKDKRLYVFRIEKNAIGKELGMISKRLAEFECLVSSISSDINNA